MPKSNLATRILYSVLKPIAQASRRMSLVLALVSAVFLGALLIATVQAQTPPPNDDQTSDSESEEPSLPTPTPIPQDGSQDSDSDGIQGAGASDPTITVTRYRSPVTEGGTVYFRFTASKAPSARLEINLRATGGTSFLTATPVKSIGLGRGRTVAWLILRTEDDNVDEPNGTVTARLLSGTGYNVGSPSSASITILDNDVAGPSIEISGLGSSVQEGRTDSFTVRASNLLSSRSYTIEVTTSNSDIGFNSSCSTRKRSTSVSRRTSYSYSLTLYGCDTIGGTVTAKLKRGTTTLDTASKSVTVDPPPPSIEISGLDTSLEEGDNDSFTVKASDLLSSSSYTIQVTTSNSDVGFNSSCSTRTRSIKVPARRTAHTSNLTLYGCDTTGGTVTAKLKRGTTTLDTASQSVRVTVPPSIAISGLVTSIEEGDSDSFSVKASDLLSSSSYTIEVTTSNSDIGFNSSCSTRTRSASVPSRRTSHTVSYALYGCETTGGKVTAKLKRGSTTLDTASQSVKVTTPPTIAISGLDKSIEEGDSDSFSVKASDLVSSSRYTIEVTTSNSDIGFNSSCSDRREDITVPARRTSHTLNLTLYGCDTTGGMVTAKLKRGTAAVDTTTQKVAVSYSVFQFSPSPLALGGTSNVWTVPTGVSRVYVDVDFSKGAHKDANPDVGDININSVNSSGTVLSTLLEVDNENDSVTLTGVAGSRIRIDVDNNAFDASLALVTLTFHSGSSTTGPEIAKATVQKESRPYSPTGGTATVDKAADSLTLSWKPGAPRLGSKPDHYRVEVTGTTFSPQNVDDSKDPAKLTISNASTTLGAGKHTAKVSHCNAAGGCSLALNITFTVEGPNRPPSFGQANYTFKIPEDSSVGDRVGVVSATDPNVGDTVTYSIVSGNSAGKFALSATTGEVTLARTIDYETSASYSLTVRAQDTTNAAADVAVAISLTNVNERPVFGPTSYDVSIPEDATIGAKVAVVATTDPDTGDTVSYSFLSGNDSGKFAINSVTGKITLAGRLERETSKSYLLRIRARDSGGLTVYAPATITVDYPLNIGSGEWGVFAYRRIVLDWIIPTSERSADHEYHLSVPVGTGFQIKSDSALNPDRCNWNSPPTSNTPWSDLDKSFYLIRCKLGIGNASITVWKRPATGALRTSTIALTIGPISQSWHRADHQVGFLIGNPFMKGTKPAHLPTTYTPDEAALKKAVNEAVQAWNKAQSYVVFETVTSSADTTIRGYWNPGTTNDMCGGSIACVTAGTSKYPHLRRQPFWIEYPPQFPGDAHHKQWTTNLRDANNPMLNLYYLPKTIMHELGHTAGLGHSPSGVGIMSGATFAAPQTYDVKGMRYTYEGHSKDH